MAKKQKEASEMSIAELAEFLEGADSLIADLQNQLSQAESDVQSYRREMAKRLGITAAPAAGTRTRSKGDEPSPSQVSAIMGEVLEAIPASGKGVTAGDIRKKLERDSRLVELAFKELNAAGKIRLAAEGAKGRFRPFVKA